MNYLLDTHSHTLASGHAYSTIQEMAKEASVKGLRLIGITEHAPNMPGTCSNFYFHNLKVVPRNMFDVELLLGVELNIVDFEGNIDLDEHSLRGLDLVIASLHPPCIESGTIIENTNAVINAIKNPYIDIIGHPDDSRYELDYEAIVKAAKEFNVLLEVNNSSMSPKSFRKNARDNYLVMLQLCKSYNVPISIGSDAHVANDIGNFDYAKEILGAVKFPEELIMNNSVERIKNFLTNKKSFINK